MEYICDKQALYSYINKFNISDVFGDDMSQYMKLCSFKCGEFIYHANEEISNLYFMVAGKAKVFTLLSNGKSLLIRFYNPLIVIGDVELMDGSPATCNVKAISTVICIGISASDLRKHALNDPLFLRFICRSLGEKLAKNSVSNAINLLYPLENRLASYILAISSEDRKASSISEIFTDKLTEMADLLGTSYRHLIRTINKLSHEGIIDKQNNIVRILDRPALENLAGDLYE